MSFPDAIVVIILVLLIPKLVGNYLGRYGFAKDLQIIIIFGGVFWIAIAFSHDIIQSFLGIADSDAVKFESWWYGQIVEHIESADYKSLLRQLLIPGRWFYVTYQGILYYYTGVTVVSILTINAFMAFWGSLTLTRLIYSFSPAPPSRKSVLPFFLIFTLSVVFWSALNLKEAMMYWSICQVFNLLMPTKSRKLSNTNFLFFIIGICLGALLRPQIILIWFIIVFLVKMLQPRFWKYLILLILMSSLFLPVINKRVNLNMLIRDPMALVAMQMESANLKYNQFVHRAERKGSGIKSTFTYSTGRPIPVFHGMINASFRPFLWQIRNLRSMLTSIEIWTISMCILFLWMRMTKVEWRVILRNPIIRVAILVSIAFFFFFSYTPNEGWIARQRVQMFPAFLVILITPLLMRRYFRIYKKRKMN